MTFLDSGDALTYANSVAKVQQSTMIRPVSRQM
jgi:hypothetical protein